MESYYINAFQFPELVERGLLFFGMQLKEAHL